MDARPDKACPPAAPPNQRGATLVEFVIVVPTLLFLLMNLVQYGLLYHTKSQLNYAAFEAARAGTTNNANPTAIRTAFTRAMTGYYGGGTTTAASLCSGATTTTTPATASSPRKTSPSPNWVAPARPATTPSATP